MPANIGPECACGCGDHLPEGSTREYKRGHKNKAFDSLNVIENDFAENRTFTLDDAAGSVDRDPEPDETEGAPRAEAPIRITKAVRKDVEGKVAFLMTMMGTMWQAADPICGTVWLNQTPELAEKLAPILCQSPDLVKWFRKGAGYMLYMDLAMAFLPVIQVIYSHHIVRGGLNDVPPQDAQAPVYAS